jgi:coenzyme F420-reducing hydrogenase delta subunit
LFIALGSKQAEEDAIEFRTITVETGEPSLHTESNELEEDKIPDTPTSMDSLHHLQKKLLLLERRESGTEESLDGSIISDIEAGDGVLTMEKLKSALRAERKTLSALYAELEEERSASAVAASQTMAMINRLQEEKAAMQMEALQYQRMMEEQSEYDQEAMQLLSELVVKREKEKAELEKELEVYRKKVQDNEMKDKLIMLKRRKDGSTTSVTTSPSCSNAEDTDGLSVDLNHEGKEVIESFDNHQESSHPNTPVDAVLYLDESLANFEEERVSILEQLKVLEEKLFMLSDEEEQHFEDMKPIEHLYQENGNGYSEICDYSSESNVVANGQHKEMNGKHHQERRNIGAKAKRLLPLFDAIDTESEDILNGHSEGFDSVALQKSVNKFDMNSKKLAVEEEVDHVYERLQALEADREFLKHCMTSLRKGDKGIELLQEILQHLRDLRNVEQRVRNLEDGAL